MPMAPYSTEGYCRNACWAKTALITTPARATGHAIFQKCFMTGQFVAKRRRRRILMHWTQRNPWMALMADASLQGLHLPKHSRNQFCYGGRDVYGVREQRRGLSRVHGRQDTVDRLVPAGPQHSGSEDVLRLAIHQYLDEPVRLALFDCAAYAGHGALAHQGRPAAAAHLRF